MIKIKKKIDKVEQTEVIQSPWKIMENAKYTPQLYELRGDDFCFLSDINCFVIPKRSTITLKDILGETEIKPWELKKLSDTPDNKHYILNQYLRGEPYYININPENVEPITGDWVCYSEGEEIEFSVLTREEFDKYRLLICFPEKTEIPYDPFKIKNKTNFILYHLWKNLQLEELSKK